MIDILDEAGQVVGTIPREEAERDNHITENVLVFVFNSLGKVWAQLRPMTKNHYPGRWDISACGGVLSGEKPEEAAVRETSQETSLEVELTYVESFINVFPGDNGEERRRLSHLFVGVSDEQPQTNEEVDKFKVWPPDKLRKDIQDKPEKYVPSFLAELDKAIAGHKKL